jgi:hypothetical protein
VDRGRLLRPVPQPTGQPLCGHHPAVRTASPSGRSSASTSDTLAVSAGSGRCHCRSRRACLMVGSRRPPCPALLRAAAVPVVDSGPSGQHPAALPDARRTPPRCPVPRTPAGGSAPGPRSRRTSTVRTLGHWTRLVDTGSRRPGAADTRDGGSVVQTLRQRHARQPAAQPSTRPPMSDQERTARCGSGQHPPWPSQVRWAVDHVGSSRIQSDRLDGQAPRNDLLVALKARRLHP